MLAGVGLFTPHKRPHLIVDAVARIDGARPRIEWVAAGADPAYLLRVGDQARAAGVDLLVHEQATDDRLIDVLSRAAALVYVSRLEPFGLVPLEAGACALPVIGIAEGGIRETVLDGVNGLLTAAEPAALARAIESLLSDPPLIERLGAAGRERVLERWTLDAAAARLEQALAEGNSASSRL
jgi:glycosyltransferase involved in cell wall biosynthesis